MYFSLCKNDLQWHLSTGQAFVSAIIVFACHSFAKTGHQEFTTLVKKEKSAEGE